MSASDFLAAFPATQRDYGTGGNCTAWRIELSKGFEILITCADNEGDYALQPTDETRRVVIDVYDSDGDRLDFEDDGAFRWSDAISIVRTFVQRGVPA